MSTLIPPRPRQVVGIRRRFAIVASQFNQQYVQGLVNHATQELRNLAPNATIDLHQVHDGLAGGAQQALLLQHLEHPARHLARAADQARELLTADLDLHAFRVRHGVGFAAQIHDGVSHAAGDIDEGQIAQLAVGAVEPCGQLRGELKHQPRALGGDLPEARVRHLGELALVAGAHPGAAGGLLVEQAHLAEELPAVQVGQHHFVAFLILDHHFHRTADDVVEDVRQVAGVDDDGLGGDRADAAVTQEPVDRGDLA